jgi:hypothetical protein
MVHTVPVQVADAAAQVPPVLVPTTLGVDQPASSQPASDQSRPPQVDVDMLLAEAPAASDEVASAAPGATTGGGEDWMASWLGALLMALGGVALLSSSDTLRRALWPVRFPDSGTERSVIAHGGLNDLSFGRSASHRPAPGESSFSTATRRVGPRTARARRPLGGLPSH